jgi:LCP family protein required for cell wall assembly
MKFRKLVLLPVNLANMILVSLAYILYFFLFAITFRFMRLDVSLYLTVFGLLFMTLILFGFVSIEAILEGKKKLQIFGISSLVILTLIMGTVVFYVFQVNSSIDKFIVNPNQQSEIETAFVVYNTDKYASVNDLNGLRLGVLSNSETTDRNSFVKDEIERVGINVTFVEYISYNEMLLGLFDKSIEFAALPADYYNQFEDNEGYFEYLEKSKTVHTFISKIQNTSESVDVDVTKEPFTLLIMGNDGGRTDSLILATYNPLKLSVTMTSIPRDSFVPIACYPNQEKDKIGHAFSVSRQCALDTVNNLFDIEINYYVEINFKGVVEIVDALDRIYVTSPVEFVGQNSDEERGHYTVWVPEGDFWATGEMALALARERYHMPGGDYQRQENQQNVIKSILERTLQLRDINKAVNVLNAAGSNVKTNMSLNQMIAVFNSLMNALNKTSTDPFYMMDIIGSRVMGYPSYTYNESLQLPLWILKPYNSSITDLRKLMLTNLESEVLPERINPQFDARLIFYSEDYFAKTYNEAEVHEKLPDFMPTMSNNNWILDQARTWSKSNGRNIQLVVEEIRVGNTLYNANFLHNYIVGQSIKYGVKTSSFNALTIKVIKHELNCSLPENQEYEECKYKLPDFQDNAGPLTTVSAVKAWFTKLGLNPKFEYILIPETDPSYTKEKVGYVIKQSPLEWTDVRTLEKLTLTVMDPNYSILIPDTTEWNETIAKKWVKDNLETEENYLITYEATTNTSLYGKVKSTIPAKNAYIKYQDILKLTIYEEGYTLANYEGKAKQNVVDELCNTNILLCSFVEVTTTIQAEDGFVKSQSVAANTTRLKSTWAESTVIFEIYKITIGP